MRRVRLVSGASALLTVALAGCGGGERQDAKEPSGSYDVAVEQASFPPSQTIARGETMRIRVRNAGDKTIPNLAVTVKGFTRRSQQAGLADPNRPLWIVDNPPRGGDTAYVGTWALGAVRPGRTRTFQWRVTPVVPGSYKLTYQVAAGLNGKAKARLAGGEAAKGEFAVRVSGTPADSRVDPESGDVVPAN